MRISDWSSDVCSSDLIGVLPTYAVAGFAAPMLLILLRILQGFSAGGEWGGAALMSVEHAPVGRRGFFGAFPQLGVPIGMILATATLWFLTSKMSPEAARTSVGKGKSVSERVNP